MTRLRLSLATLFGASLILTPLASAHAGVSTFSEPCDGGFSRDWTARPGALPDEPLSPFRPNVVAYRGGQHVKFTIEDGVSVARLSVENAPSWSRFGYLSREHLSGTIGEVEARINTLDQGSPFIDGLFDLWLVSSEEPSQYVRIGMFGDRSDTLRSWTYSSSLSPYSTAGDGNLPPFIYQNDTWYRLRITQFPGKALEVSIWNDAGSERFVSHRFNFMLADLGDSFQIGFSQWMGGPNRTNSLQCAVGGISAWLAR